VSDNIVIPDLKHLNVRQLVENSGDAGICLRMLCSIRASYADFEALFEAARRDSSD